jgi:6-phosphofructokinase
MDAAVMVLADPTYMIRAIPSNASDNVYCTLLAHSAVHGLMAGYTGFTVGPVNGRHAYIPIEVSMDRRAREPWGTRPLQPGWHRRAYPGRTSADGHCFRVDR